MIQLKFKCTLLTDVSISAQTATEGEHHSLNFIPGDDFLGILAGELYNDNIETSYTLFHSGKVRFGDAHINFGKFRSLQIPFSWYYPKGGSLDEKENYMLNFMSNENFDSIISKGIQLKQARNGFFSKEETKYISLAKTYSQKSAINSDSRRSAEGKMFGYEALQEVGSEWGFCIDVDKDLINKSDNIIEMLKTLEGKKRLGRSKTAEFGRANIEFIEKQDIESAKINPKEIILENSSIENDKITYSECKKKLVFLYAESRLAFRDQFGQPTFMPTPVQLGLPENSNILWERSQIRTGIYAPWNLKRKSDDEDRVFIEKGSVFVVDVSEISQPLTDENIYKGVGLYRVNGFGKLLINPEFLEFNPDNGKLIIELNEIKKNRIPIAGAESIINDSELITWIKQQNDFKKILKKVDDFINSNANRFKKVSSSQWGNMRLRAFSSKSKEDLLRVLFEEPSKGNDKGGDLTHGIASDQWEEGRDLLKKTIKELQLSDKLVLNFVEKLSARMQKKGGSK